MRIRITTVAAAFVFILAAGPALAAEKDTKSDLVTVVYKDGNATVELRGLEISSEDSGLFGSSARKLKKLPMKADRLALEVPIERIAKIEVLAADKDGKNVKLRLTATDGKTLEGTLDPEKKVVFKATHPFAESEATLSLVDIKEIILKPAQK